MILVTKNPYRIVGVTGNSKIKEIEKNLSKLRSYLSIGKQLNLPFDNKFFGTIQRGDDEIKFVRSVLNLDQNKLEQALFWLVDANDIDSIAIEHIKKGNIDKSFDIWNKQVQKSTINKNNYSYYNNLSTLLLCKEDYKQAIKLKSNLIESSAIQLFVRLVCDSNFKISKSDLIDLFIEFLISGLKKSGMNADLVIENFSETSEKIKDKVCDFYVKDPVSHLERYIKKTIELCKEINKTQKKEIKVSLSALKKVLGKKLYSDVIDLKNKVLIKAGTKLNNAHINIIIESNSKFIFLEIKNKNNKNSGDYGRELMIQSKNEIKKIAKILGTNHYKYKFYADKLATQLEQCGILCFNETGNDLNYLDVYKYALIIAESDNVKNRLKEALKHCSQLKKNQNVNFIVALINKFSRKRPSTLNYLKNAEILLKDCKPYLEKIKLDLGNKDELYIKLTNGLANVIMGGIIKVNNIDNSKVNKALEKFNKYGGF